MSRAPVLILGFMLTAGCSEAAMRADAGTSADNDGGPVLPEPDASVASAVTPLVGNSLEGPLDDLAPFGALVASARLIGIGESVHGSDGMNDMRARAIRYLIEEQGVRVVGIEFNPSDLREDAIPYIATCEGTAREAVSTWANFAGSGNARLLEWMCHFNQAHPEDPVRIYGFDMLEGPKDIAFLTDTVTGWELEHGDALLTALRSCIGSANDSTDSFYEALEMRTLPTPTEEGHDLCLQAVEGMQESYGIEEVDEVVLALRRLEWWERMWWASFRGQRDEAQFIRDEGMAWLSRAVLNYEFSETERAVLIAHNAHLAYDYANADPLEGNGVLRMGTYLHEEEGDAYIAIAQTALVVEAINIWWPDGRTIEAPPGEHVAERIMATYPEDYYFVSLLSDHEQPFDASLSYSFGWDGMILRDQFGGFFWLRDSPGGESYADSF